MTEAKKKLNDEFKNRKDIEDKNEILEMIKFGDEANDFLKTMVIQAVKDGESSFKLNITKDTTMLDNVSYDPEAVERAYEEKRNQRKNKKK